MSNSPGQVSLFSSARLSLSSVTTRLPSFRSPAHAFGTDSGTTTGPPSGVRTFTGAPRPTVVVRTSSDLNHHTTTAHNHQYFRSHHRFVACQATKRTTFTHRCLSLAPVCVQPPGLEAPPLRIRRESRSSTAPPSDWLTDASPFTDSLGNHQICDPAAAHSTASLKNQGDCELKEFGQIELLFRSHLIFNSINDEQSHCIIMAIDCLVLGAGQEVGKSCVVVSINGKKIMFDCGMHMGYHDRRRYPDFSRISGSGNFDSALSCIIITHFHLDHVGALPYFTEVCGYHGPIYMTYPTKALSPLMLEDYRKVMVDRVGEEEQFTSDHIAACMEKVIAVDLRQTVQVDEDLEIRAYYAGHVLGAAMFYARVGDTAILYTGDYNMTPDRHLGAAQVDRLQLDLVITESTYATTVRDSKYAREREFLKAVHKCVAGGGKVLIPTFALGRAQELCILLEDYWERMNLKVPIYFSAGLTIQANMYYKMLISWTSQKVKETYNVRNAFDFRHVCTFDRSLINVSGACVLFATPGMISGGFSLEVFKQWAPSEKNLVTLPGYCVAGTIGHRLMSGKPTKIDLDPETQIDVRCQIHQLAFSPHTDSKGIMDLIRFLCPKHVILVHGEKPKMAALKGKIQTELGIQCYDPANNETISIPSSHYVRADASDLFIQSSLSPNFKFKMIPAESDPHSKPTDTKQASKLLISDVRVAEGILVMEKNQKAKIVHIDELVSAMGKDKHEVQFAYCCPVRVCSSENTSAFDGTNCWVHLLDAKLRDAFDGVNIENLGESLWIESVRLSLCSRDDCPYRLANDRGNSHEMVFFCCAWSIAEHEVAWKVISVLKSVTLESR